MSGVTIDPLSEYLYEFKLLIDKVGKYMLTVRLHYSMKTYYGFTEKGPLEVEVLNLIILEAKAGKTFTGSKIVFKVYVGLPYVKAKLQIYDNSSNEVKNH